jgi:hypothetical protein
MRHIALFVILLSVASHASVADEFKPPEDGVFTEKQFLNYVAVTSEWLATSQAAGKAMEGSQSSAGALAVLAKTDEKLRASLEKHGLSEDEYSWIAGKAWEAFGVATMQDTFGKQANDNLAEQMKETDKELARLQARLDQYEAAQKAGRKVMTTEERQAVIDAAKAETTAAAAEIKEHVDEANQATTEAAQKEREASEAENLAKNPPPDISSDDREGYITDRKHEAQAARDAAKEARDRAAQANKTIQAIKTRVAAAEKVANNPDEPTSDDEAAQTKTQNEQAIQSTRQEIAAAKQTASLLKESQKQTQLQLDEIKSKSPARNVEIVKAHRAEFEKIYNLKTPDSKK